MKFLALLFLVVAAASMPAERVADGSVSFVVNGDERSLPDDLLAIGVNTLEGNNVVKAEQLLPRVYEVELPQVEELPHVELPQVEELPHVEELPQVEEMPAVAVPIPGIVVRPVPAIPQRPIVAVPIPGIVARPVPAIPQELPLVKPAVPEDIVLVKPALPGVDTRPVLPELGVPETKPAFPGIDTRPVLPELGVPETKPAFPGIDTRPVLPELGVPETKPSLPGIGTKPVLPEIGIVPLPEIIETPSVPSGEIYRSDLVSVTLNHVGAAIDNIKSWFSMVINTFSGSEVEKHIVV